MPEHGLGLFLLEPIAVGSLLVVLAAILLVPRPRMIGRFLFLAIICLCLWRFMVDSVGYRTVIFDDAFMFSRYAHNLLTQGQLAWNPDGVPVYGLTSPFYLVAVIPIQLLVPNVDPLVTLTLTSRLSGIAFILTLIALLWISLPLKRDFRQVAIAVIIVSLTWNGTASLNAANGMDTTFDMWMLTLYLLLACRFAQKRETARILPAAVVGGLLFWVRPEYMVYSVLIPLGLIVFARDKHERGSALCFGAMTAGVLGVILAVNAAYFGTALPLPFFAKSGGMYQEPNLLRNHEPMPFAMLVYFIVDYLPFFVIILLTTVLANRRWWKAERPDIRMVATGTAFLLVDYLFFVLQVMFFYQRFYHHVLPAIAFLAGHMLAYWLARDRIASALTHLWQKRQVLVTAAIGTFMALWMADWMGASFQPIDYDQPTNRLEIARIFAEAPPIDEADSDLVWPGLSGMVSISDSLTIATTEVGRISVISQQFTIVDLAGLNNPQMVFEGFKVNRLLEQAPDVVYFHPDYNLTNNLILEDVEFQRLYEHIPASRMDTVLGVAVRRDSANYLSLVALMQKAVDAANAT